MLFIRLSIYIVWYNTKHHMWGLKMKEMTLNKKCRWDTPIKILSMMTLALLMLANIAGAAPFAYITNMDSNTTSVIDIANNTVTATVPVGSGPEGVAVSPDGTKAYVSNFFRNNKYIISSISVTIYNAG
jgi:YVTN family beta-propeller protein